MYVADQEVGHENAVAVGSYGIGIAPHKFIFGLLLELALLAHRLL